MIKFLMRKEIEKKSVIGYVRVAIFLLLLALVKDAKILFPTANYVNMLLMILMGMHFIYKKF